jgi:hypothetical protein
MSSCLKLTRTLAPCGATKALETLYSMSVGKKPKECVGAYICRKDAGQVWFSPIYTSEGPAINSGVEDRALFPDSTAYILP